MIPFVKAHACGNDFLIVDEKFTDGKHAMLARAMCSRNTGVGADGVEFVQDRRIRLFNSDGSEAEISGNGTRCVAAWMSHRDGALEILLETDAGNRMCKVLSVAGVHYEIESQMGTPTVVRARFEDIDGVIVSTGNPHFVIFTNAEDFSHNGQPWIELGKRISEAPQFVNGTNVEFVRIRNREEISIRIYERGAGPTSSSGTGSCASAAAAIATQGLSRTLKVQAPGGPQFVRWETDDQQIVLTGPADLVARGEFFL